MPPALNIQPPAITGAKPSSPEAGKASAEAAVKAAKEKSAPEPLNDAFAEIDKIVGEVPPEPKKESVQPPPKPAKAQPSGTEKASAPSVDKDDTALGGDAKSGTSAEPAEKPAEKPTQERPIEKMAPKELRTAYENLKRDFHKVRDDFEKLKAAPPPDDTEKKSLLQTLEQERKAAAELRKELSFRDYTTDPEFIKSYQKPYEEAWSNAISDLEQLTVAEMTPDADTGEMVKSGERKASVQDMISLSNMPLGEAWKKANEWFGAAASSIMHHRNTIVDLHRKQTKALEEHKTNATEYQKQRQAQMAEQHARIVGLWQQENDAVAKKYPQWFAPDPQDPEGTEILKKGMALADKMFTNGNMKPEDAVRLHSAIRNKAGAFDRMVHVNKKLHSRIAELEEELESYKKSEPKAGHAAKTKDDESPKTASWEDEIDAMAKA